MRISISRFAATVLALAPLPATAEIIPAPAGTKVEYTCTGPYSKSIVTKIVASDANSFRWESNSDGRSGYGTKPLWAVPTTIATLRNRGDDKGERIQKFDAVKFAGLAKLETGSSFDGFVDEAHDKSSWTWGYKVTVGEHGRVSHPVVGDVETVRINEKRWVNGGNYESKMSVELAPALGHSLGWSYTDRKGTQDCRLTSKSG